MCFFFSSRRRHTRLTCDWSSDVCSSDLWGLARRAGWPQFRDHGPTPSSPPRRNPPASGQVRQLPPGVRHPERNGSVDLRRAAPWRTSQPPPRGIALEPNAWAARPADSGTVRRAAGRLAVAGAQVPSTTAPSTPTMLRLLPVKPSVDRKAAVGESLRRAIDRTYFVHQRTGK